MKLDTAKLQAAGFTVEEIDGGAMIAAPQMTAPAFVSIEPNGEMQLITQRSAFHRAIYEALAGVPAPDGPP